MRIQRHASLAGRSSFRLGGSSRLFAEPETVEELAGLIARLRREGTPYWILGGGTNTLFLDGGFDGWVISTLRLVGVCGSGPGRLMALPGTSFARVIAEALARGWGGLERFVGIPGTVGGAVFGNAGSGREAIGERVHRIEVVDRCGTLRSLPGSEVAWRYRSSGLADVVIARVELALEPGDREPLVAIACEVARRKHATQPLVARSAGCIFRNPPGQHAARLIQDAGLAGTRLGGARVSPRHVNFIVNEGGATAADVVALIELVESRVRDRFGVALQREVALVGHARAGEMS